MDLTNVQPTTPIGGYAAGGAPSEPDELGSRESARAVLSAMLETPADPGSASAGGGGINLQSKSSKCRGPRVEEHWCAGSGVLAIRDLRKQKLLVHVNHGNGECKCTSLG